MRWLNVAARGRSIRRPADVAPTAPGPDSQRVADRTVPPESVAPLAPARKRSTIAPTPAIGPLRLRHTDRL